MRSVAAPVPAKPWLIWLIAGVLAVGAFALYAPSLRSGLVYDAEEQILNDDYIHTPAHLADVVSLRVLSRDVLDGDRPVHLFFLMVDSLGWGRQPLGYHLTSNLFHAANVALVFLLLVTLAQARGAGVVAAAIGAIFFALHPVNVEAVAEPSNREDPLATFFLLLGLWLVTRISARWDRRADWMYAAGGLISFFLAAGAKETGYVAPALLACYWLLYRRKENWRPWARFFAAVCVVVLGFAAARFALPPAHSLIFSHRPSYIGGSLGAALAVQPSLWAFLVRNIFWPLHLSADYVGPDIAGFTLPVALLILAVFVAMQGLLAWRSRLAFLGAMAFWLGLAPVSNFIPLYHPLADRFLYLPLFGMAALICAALTLVPARFTWAVWFLSALALLPLAVLTVQRQDVFANSVNLWQDTMAKSPYSDTAANNLGWAVDAKGDHGGALQYYNRALQLTQGKEADAWAGAAISLQGLGRLTEAEAALNKAIAQDEIYGKPDELFAAMRISRANANVLKVILARMHLGAR